MTAASTPRGDDQGAATPSERSIEMSNVSSASKPTKTVSPGEHHRTTRGRDRKGNSPAADSKLRQLLAEAADDDQRVVDSQPQAEHGDQVQ